MSRLIDADELKTKKVRCEERAEWVVPVAEIDWMPTIEPERKKGRFIGTEYDGYADGNPVYYAWECSECGCVFEDEEPTYNFCPNCGADMRGGDAE